MQQQQYDIIVIGAGGVCSALIPILAKYVFSPVFPHQVSSFVIADGDSYEEKNIERQFFPTALTGMNKASAQIEKLKILYRHKADILYSFDEYVMPSNIHQLIEGSNYIILAGVDNHPCRLLLSQFVQQYGLQGSLLISGGNETTDGNVQIFGYDKGDMIGVPLEQRHPEIATDTTDDRSKMSCQEMYEMKGGDQLMVANTTAAMLMYSLFWCYTTGKDLRDIIEVYFDIPMVSFRTVRKPRVVVEEPVAEVDEEAEVEIMSEDIMAALGSSMSVGNLSNPSSSVSVFPPQSS